MTSTASPQLDPPARTASLAGRLRLPRTTAGRLLLLTGAVRIVLEVGGIASVAIDGSGHWPSSALSMWSHWDAPHYLRIAEVGYKRTGEDGLFIVFFPLYPLAVWVTSLVARSLVLSGLVVSFAASAVACLLLHRLVALEAPRDGSPRRAVLLLVAFPTAYFLAAPYSESLFLAAVIGAVYAARTGRWRSAAAAGALATGTRVAGLAVLPALACAAILSEGTVRDRARRLLSAVAASAGFAGYLALNRVVRGDALAFLEVQRTHWFQRLVPPWEPVVAAVTAVRSGDIVGDRAIVFWGRLLAFVFAVAVLAAGWRRMGWIDRVYSWTGFVLVLSASWLLSLPRYLLGVYPLFVTLARLTRRRVAFVAMTAACVALQVWLWWRYARGAWTF